ncbi:MAG: hypothetical protein WC551_10455 [Patescibacteria group bacterium]
MSEQKQPGSESTADIAERVRREQEARRAHEQKIAEIKKRNLEERAQVRAAVQMARTDRNVEIILRHLAKICGQFKNAIVMNPTTGEIITSSTIYNESRRSVYLDFRKLMSEEDKRLIESKGEEDHGE